MRRFSRWMPSPVRRRATIGRWLMLAAMVGGLIAALIAWPVIVVSILVAIIVISVFAGIDNSRRLRLLAAERTGEGIGTFARAFDRRTEPFDPWVLRATWDALGPYVNFRGGRMPLRPTDRLEKDLRIDGDDLGLDIVPEIANRAGYSLDNPQANPLFGHIQTVGGLGEIHSVTAETRMHRYHYRFFAFEKE